MNPSVLDIVVRATENEGSSTHESARFQDFCRNRAPQGKRQRHEGSCVRFVFDLASQVCTESFFLGIRMARGRSGPGYVDSHTRSRQFTWVFSYLLLISCQECIDCLALVFNRDLFQSLCTAQE